ncbi:MAG: gamma-glutamyltransferase, partial [Candidatus Tectomicrobia bacterium]|nr:gamma-glutamyltransferase [Candidatus Tectomicrobia bacterium]
MTAQRKVDDVEHQAARGETSRPVIWGTQGIVSSGHSLTSMAAMRMLLSGGNAFDAAVAAGFAAAVIEPTAAYSLAAEGSILLYHAASRELKAVSGQGVAPKGATVDFFKKRGFDKIPTGPGPDAHLSFTVPGVVDAYFKILETYGTKSLTEVLAPSIHYAEHGFPMYESMYRILQTPGTIEHFQLYPPGGAEIFFPNGKTPRVGQRFVQRELGATLKKLVEAERSAPGTRLAGLRAARDRFYLGDIAQTIANFSKKVGGLLDLEDLANYQAKFEVPISTTFAGYEICGQSTWTQGAVLLQSLNILESFDLKAMGHNSTPYIHTVTEAIKLAFADRERYYGDPNFARVPISGLLSKEYAAERSRLIKPDKAYPELPPSGNPWRYDNGEVHATAPSIPAMRREKEVAAGADGGTTHLAVIDRDGNMICMTPSGGSFRKSAFIPEIGCALSTRIEMFFVDADHPNEIQPGKRPRTTLVNYMVCRDGEPIMTIGCPGGDNQAQANLQLILNVLVFGMNPQEAVEAPR